MGPISLPLPPPLNSEITLFPALNATPQTEPLNVPELIDIWALVDELEAWILHIVQLAVGITVLTKSSVPLLVQDSNRVVIPWLPTLHMATFPGPPGKVSLILVTLEIRNLSVPQSIIGTFPISALTPSVIVLTEEARTLENRPRETNLLPYENLQVCGTSAFARLLRNRRKTKCR